MSETSETRIHRHDFGGGPNCSVCGLHASVTEGGSLSPQRITRLLAQGTSVTISPGEAHKKETTP